MNVRTHTFPNEPYRRLPDHRRDVPAADLVSGYHDAPVPTGCGRYGPKQGLTKTMVVGDLITIIEADLPVASGDRTGSAGPSGIFHIPMGRTAIIQPRTEVPAASPHRREAR